jgi:hypothetical protein
VPPELAIERFLPPDVGELKRADQRSSLLLSAAAADVDRLLVLASRWQQQLVAACRYFGWLSLTTRVLELVVWPRKFGVDSVSSQAVFETLALAALESSRSDDPPVKRLVPTDSAVDMHDLCGSLVKTAMLIAEHSRGRRSWSAIDPPTALDEMRSAQIREAIMNREPGHFLHPDVELLKALFDFDRDIERLWATITGLSPRTVLQFSGYLSSRAVQLLEAIREGAAKQSNALSAALDRRWREARQGLTVPIAVTDELVHVPPDTPQPVLRELALAAEAAVVARAAGSIGPDDLLEAEAQAGVPQEEFSKYLALFGGDHRFLEHSDVVARPLEARLALRRRPVLHIGGRHSFVPLPNQVANGLRRRLDEDLMSDARTAKRYRTLRARFTETRTADLMLKLTGAEVFAAPAYYPLRSGGRAEIDAVLEIGPYLFLVEVKGRDLRPRAQAGSPDALVGDLRKIVQDASRQLARAKEHVTQYEVEVQDARGRRVPLSASPERVFAIAVTYERLVGLAPTTWRLEDEGLVDRGLDPWIISLPELAVVAEILEPPFELPAYLKWRQAVLQFRTLDVIEEGDLLMAFVMDDGASLQKAVADYSDVPSMLADQTQPLSDYYNGRAHGSDAEKPRRIPRRAEQDLMTALARCESPAKWVVAEHLLSLGGDDRQRVTKRLLRTMRSRPTRFGRGGGSHSTSVVLELDRRRSPRTKERDLDPYEVLGENQYAAVLMVDHLDSSISDIQIEPRPAQGTRGGGPAPR